MFIWVQCAKIKKDKSQDQAAVISHICLHSFLVYLLCSGHCPEHKTQKGKNLLFLSNFFSKIINRKWVDCWSEVSKACYCWFSYFLVFIMYNVLFILNYFLVFSSSSVILCFSLRFLYFHKTVSWFVTSYF